MSVTERKRRKRGSRVRCSERGKFVRLNISPLVQTDLSLHLQKIKKVIPPRLSCLPCLSLSLRVFASHPLIVILILVPIPSHSSVHTHLFQIYPFISRVSLERAVWLSRLITLLRWREDNVIDFQARQQLVACVCKVSCGVYSHQCHFKAFETFQICIDLYLLFELCRLV